MNESHELESPRTAPQILTLHLVLCKVAGGALLTPASTDGGGHGEAKTCKCTSWPERTAARSAGVFRLLGLYASCAATI
jgi:hypothetical protein